MKSLYCLLPALLCCACGEPRQDYTITHAPALSLPPVDRGAADTGRPAAAATTAPLSLAAAVKRSSLVFRGIVKMTDSTIHGQPVPFYLVGVEVQEVAKGIPGAAMLYYISRKLPEAGEGRQVFFLEPADSSNVLAHSNRLRWQWTTGAPAATMAEVKAALADAGPDSTTVLQP